MKNEYLKIFSNCIFVKGYTRSAIQDIQRGEIHFCPNHMEDFIIELEHKNLNEISSVFSSKRTEEYINFLVSRNLAFFCNKEELSLFPKLSLTFSNPSVITNSVIDFNHSLNYEHWINELDNFGCKAIQIRCIRENSVLDDLEKILEIICKTRIESISILINDSNYSKTFIDEFLLKFPFISKITLFSVTGKAKKYDNNYSSKIKFVENDLSYEIDYSTPYATPYC